MNGTNPPDSEAQQRKPSPLVEVVARRLQEAVAEAKADPDGAQAGAGYAEEAERRRAMRREVRRRDMEIARLVAMESMAHTSEYIAGRLPGWKRDIFEHVRDPVASLANLSRAVIQLTLAEDRFDESDAERIERVKAEAEANARAAREAETARAYTDGQIRRAENKRQVHQTVRAVTIAGLKLGYAQREDLLAGLFKELEAEDIYDADPAETIADICVRLGIAGSVDLKPILERRKALAELARSHIEALRGKHPLDTEGDPASEDPVTAFTHTAKAQGPPH